MIFKCNGLVGWETGKEENIITVVEGSGQLGGKGGAASAMHETIVPVIETSQWVGGN